jgi:DNA repair exonuclease SbcCD ATPase subunit
MRASDVTLAVSPSSAIHVVPNTLTRVSVKGRPPQARQLLLLLVLLLLPVALLAVCSSAWAQSTNTREQEQIRRLRQQLQQLQQEQSASAQSAQRAQTEAAENKRLLDALKADLNRSRGVADSAKKQASDLAAKQAQDAAQLALDSNTLRAERDALQAKATEQDTLLARNALDLNTLRQEVAQRQNSLSLRANTLADLNQRHQRQAEGLQMCMANNQALHQLGKELLDLYVNKGTGEVFLQVEPVLQFKRVALENLVQGYQDKLDQQALKPAAVSREP